MAASEKDGEGGVWMRKRTVPSSVYEQFKDGYVDMLAERRKPFNDLSWVLKSVKTTGYKYNHPRDYKQLIKDTLVSDRVRFTIEEISKESGQEISDVKNEARSIITEMAHQFNMRSVRTLGYAIMKVFKTILDHIYINADGLHMLSELVQEYPVLLVPSHRSYMDFLIFSIICFDYDLPLPAIVAAQDFMGMAIIGTMLRNSGAFYIRRTFRSDKLYWAIFTEYVQTQLCNGDHPIEFFVEGTRSRTQKAMAPKLGMLAASLEAYFKGKVPDVMILPVSISYDRVLEENLFAQELLGIPKPKESTSKLFKALSVLKENYGSVHVTLSQALSVRQMCTDRIHRPIHSMEPRYIVGVTDEEEMLIEEIGYAIIWQQQKHMVLSVWCLIATVVLQNTNGITLQNLTETVLWLKRHANNVGAYIDWPGGLSDENVIRKCVLAHSGHVLMQADFITIAPVDHGDRLKLAHVKGENLADAATHMILSLYRNQLVHSFVPYSILSMIILKSQEKQNVLLSQETARNHFVLFGRLLANEFVLNKRELEKSFNNALQLLTHTSDIILDDNGNILLSRSVTRFTQFLSNMLLPFITAYWIVCQYLMNTTYDIGTGKESVTRPKELLRCVQHFSLSLLNSACVDDHEVLNLDILNNSLQALKDRGAIYYETRNGEKFAAVRSPVIAEIVNDIESGAPVPNISQEKLRLQATEVAIQAKL